MVSDWQGSYFSVDERELEIIDFDPLENRLPDGLMEFESGLYGAWPIYDNSNITWDFEPVSGETNVMPMELEDIDAFDFRLWLDNKPEKYRIGILSKCGDDVYLFMSMPLEDDSGVYTSAEHINQFLNLSRQLNSV